MIILGVDPALTQSVSVTIAIERKHINGAASTMIYLDDDCDFRRMREEFSRCVAEATEARRRLDELRRRHASSIKVINDDMIFKSSGRVTTGGAGMRMPRSAPPSRFAFYQGDF